MGYELITSDTDANYEITEFPSPSVDPQPIIEEVPSPSYDPDQRRKIIPPCDTLIPAELPHDTSHAAAEYDDVHDLSDPHNYSQDNDDSDHEMGTPLNYVESTGHSTNTVTPHQSHDNVATGRDNVSDDLSDSAEGFFTPNRLSYRHERQEHSELTQILQSANGIENACDLPSPYLQNVRALVRQFSQPETDENSQKRKLISPELLNTKRHDNKPSPSGPPSDEETDDELPHNI